MLNIFIMIPWVHGLFVVALVYSVCIANNSMVWCGVVWCGVVWCDVVWRDIVWYDVVWYCVL